MRVTLLGHASTLVETSSGPILVDPVLGEQFGEGLLEPNPSRRVHIDRLPSPSVIVITSSASDHFDLDSLGRLPRESKVLCPDDDVAPYALSRLGFSNVRAVPANTALKMGSLTLVVTPSMGAAPATGLALQDESGLFFHEANTIAPRDTIDLLRDRFGGVDLCFASYAPPEYAYFGAQHVGFPSEYLVGAASHAALLGPKLLVPGSCGVRYRTPMEWVNRVVFPISAARFLRELRRLNREARAAIGAPGDTFDIHNRTVTHHRHASPFVEVVDDDTSSTDFDAGAPVAPLSDPNLEDYPPATLQAEVEAAFEGLERFVRDGYHSGEKLVAWYRAQHLDYVLGVVFPDGRERSFRCRFDETNATFERTDGRARGALVTHRMAASVLAARARYDRRYEYSGGLSRLCMMTPASLVGGRVTLASSEPPDLLVHYLAHRAPGLSHHARMFVDRDLARLASRDVARVEPRASGAGT